VRGGARLLDGRPGVNFDSVRMCPPSMQGDLAGPFVSEPASSRRPASMESDCRKCTASPARALDADAGAG